MQSVCCSLFDPLQKFYFSFVYLKMLKNKINYVKICCYWCFINYDNSSMCITTLYLPEQDLKRNGVGCSLIVRIAFFEYRLSSWYYILSGKLSFSLHFLLKRVKGQYKNQWGKGGHINIYSNFQLVNIKWSLICSSYTLG